MSDELLTWGQASRLYTKAGVSISTFNRRLDEGTIQAAPGKGKRSAKYSRMQVMSSLQNEKKTTSRPVGATDWVCDSDLIPLLKLDRERYGEYTVDISITQHWWRKNPYMCRVLFNKDNREDIWGAITIMPLEEKTIYRLLTGEIEEKDLTADDILLFEDGGRYHGYVPSAVISLNHRESFKMLLDSVFDYWCEQYPNIQFAKLYAFASSPEGEDVIRKLFFAPRYDLGDNAFELDPYRRNPSPFIKKFQMCMTKAA